ncbi:MAG: hypothetical protein NT126_04715 [Bacteroidetes bacterium]|nr:hypothetical protein [Bacteroidota bacterium]
MRIFKLSVLFPLNLVAVIFYLLFVLVMITRIGGAELAFETHDENRV